MNLKIGYCPNCEIGHMDVFYKIINVPVNSCIMLKDKQSAINFPRHDIILALCNTCGFISNIAFDKTKVNYSSIYEDQQCFSTTFNSFIDNITRQIIHKYNLYGKKIIEIGCGKGDFLKLLCELGNNSGIGIDPAFVAGRGDPVPTNLSFIKDYYSERYITYDADFFCCRHTLEHIPDPLNFMTILRRAIGKNFDRIILFELPDVTRVLKELAFWDIYYEHCSYFNAGSLARLFRYSNFEISDIYRDFNDQYLLIEARPVKEKSTKINDLEETINQIKSDVTFFTNNYNKKISYWRSLLQKFSADGKRIAIWGSGSKCVAFITTLDMLNEIEYIVVDINPHRHHKYLPGIGKEILPPEFLRHYKPDVIVIMNRIYFEEIKKSIATMKITPQVLTV